jgi:hypothetical protein
MAIVPVKNNTNEIPNCERLSGEEGRLSPKGKRLSRGKNLHLTLQ